MRSFVYLCQKEFYLECHPWLLTQICNLLNLHFITGVNLSTNIFVNTLFKKSFHLHQEKTKQISIFIKRKQNKLTAFTHAHIIDNGCCIYRYHSLALVRELIQFGYMLKTSSWTSKLLCWNKPCMWQYCALKSIASCWLVDILSKLHVLY